MSRARMLVGGAFFCAAMSSAPALARAFASCGVDIGAACKPSQSYQFAVESTAASSYDFSAGSRHGQVRYEPDAARGGARFSILIDGQVAASSYFPAASEYIGLQWNSGLPAGNDTAVDASCLTGELDQPGEPDPAPSYQCVTRSGDDVLSTFTWVGKDHGTHADEVSFGGGALDSWTGVGLERRDNNEFFQMGLGFKVVVPGADNGLTAFATGFSLANPQAVYEVEWSNADQRNPLQLSMRCERQDR